MSQTCQIIIHGLRSMLSTIYRLRALVGQLTGIEHTSTL